MANMGYHKAKKPPTFHQHLPNHSSLLWRHPVEERLHPASLAFLGLLLAFITAVSPLVQTRLPSTEAFKPDRKLLMDSNLRFALS